MGSVSNFLLTLVNILNKGFHLYRVRSRCFELLRLIVHCLFFLVQVILTQKPRTLLLFCISILKHMFELNVLYCNLGVVETRVFVLLGHAVA